MSDFGSPSVAEAPLSALHRIIGKTTNTHSSQVNASLRNDRLSPSIYINNLPLHYRSRFSIAFKLRIVMSKANAAMAPSFASFLSASLRRLDLFLSSHFLPSCLILLLSHLLLSILIIHKVSYTEIDWKAYMQEVSPVIHDDQFDYHQLKGDTGPLVYPAGFVYVFSMLYFLTDQGTNIRLAQYLFALLHTLTLALLLRLYYRLHNVSRGKIPLYTVLFLFMSRRVTSLFVLRLFNDAVESFLALLSVLLFTSNSWSLGCLIYSLSVSIKMNALLFAPGLCVLLCQSLGFRGFLTHFLFIIIPVQFLLGFPFLYHAPFNYLSRAFELSRVFMHKWSVNYAFLPEHVFISKRLSVILLLLHLCVLLLFAHRRWTVQGLLRLLHLQNFPNIYRIVVSLLSDTRTTWLHPYHITLVLCTSNFIGIVFSRTLHYQFYVWYFHTLPFLIFHTSLPLRIKPALLLAVEVVFNKYPPHGLASLILHFVHMTLLFALWNAPSSTPVVKEISHSHAS